MNKIEKEAFLCDLKLICEKHGVSFTTAKTILHQNAFFPNRTKVVVIKPAKYRQVDLEKRQKHVQKLMDEINAVNGSNFKGLI